MTELTSRVLLLGSGGREHALAWKLSLSPLVDTIYVLPGNSGTASIDKCTNIPGPWKDHHAIVSLASAVGITLFVPTMEEELINGIADAFIKASSQRTPRSVCAHPSPVCVRPIPICGHLVQNPRQNR